MNDSYAATIASTLQSILSELRSLTAAVKNLTAAVFGFPEKALGLIFRRETLFYRARCIWEYGDHGFSYFAGGVSLPQRPPILRKP